MADTVLDHKFCFEGNFFRTTFFSKTISDKIVFLT